MTLRWKTLLITSLSLLGLFAIILLVMPNILLEGFAIVEQHDMTQNLRRVVDVVNDEIGDMDKTLWDNASWDDTYEYVQAPFDEYELFDETLAMDYLGIGVVIMFDLDLDVVGARLMNLDTLENLPSPQPIIEHLQTNTDMFQFEELTEGKTGVLLLPGLSTILGIRPILSSDDSGEPRGYFIFGRMLDEFLNSLIQITHLNIDTFWSNDPAMPEDVRQAQAQLSDQTPTWMSPLSEDIMAGYTQLAGINGAPHLLLRLEIPRNVYHQGLNSLSSLTVALGAIGVVFILVSLGMLEWLVLKRVSILSIEVESVAASQDISLRMSKAGEDELGQLAGNINWMLQALQDALVREEKLKQEIQELRIEINQSEQDKQVADITGTDYFSELQQKAKDIRQQHTDEA